MVKLLSEAEQIRPEVKRNDEVICSQEGYLVQARNESKLIKASLHKARAALASEIAQCKSLEKELTQKSNEVELAKLSTSESSDPGVEGGEKHLEQLECELEDMKKKHKEHLNTIQQLWMEGEEEERKDLAHGVVVEPLEEEMRQLKHTYEAQRGVLLNKVQQMYDMLTFGSEQVCSSLLKQFVHNYAVHTLCCRPS